MARGRAKWCKTFSIGIFFFVGLGCSKFHPPIERMGCLPIFQTNASMEIFWAVGTATDILSEHLKTCFSSRIYVYPIHQLRSALAVDSLSDLFYRIRYAKKLDLDWFITISLDSSLSLIQLKCHRFDRNRAEAFSFRLNFPLNSWPEAVLSVIDTLTQYENWPHSCTFSIPKHDGAFWKMYGKAIISYWGENLDLAESTFQRLITMDPQWEKMILSRIEILLQMANRSSSLPKDYFYAQADTLLYFLESKKCAEYKLPWFRGKWYLQQERWHSAEISLVSAYRRYAQDPLLWMDISCLHPSRFRKLGFSDRISIYQKVLKVDPTCEEAWISLTEALLHQGKLDVVENLCKKWLSIFPRSLDGWFTLAKVAALRNDFLKLTEIYHQLIEWYPNQPEVYYNLGVLYFHLKRFSDAEAFFLKVLERNGHPDAYYYLGLIYEYLHQAPKAIQAYQKRIAFRESRSDRYAEQARIRLQWLLAKDESH